MFKESPEPLKSFFHNGEPSYEKLLPWCIKVFSCDHSNCIEIKKCKSPCTVSAAGDINSF